MEELKNKKYWVWLSLIKGIGSRKKLQLLKLFQTPERIYNLKENQLEKVSGIGEKTIKNILNPQIRNSLDYHIEFMKKNKIDIISINEESYPHILRQIYDPPISLYIRGNKEILNQKSIAIIGCREATSYGKEVAKYLSSNLSKQGINIISGLAKGVDSYAHIGIVYKKTVENYKQSTGKSTVDNVETVENFKNCGKPIAVLGNGLDCVYPKENILLAKQILKVGGAIISEYPLGTKPEKMNFPARNRIISGMSNSILVVEAREKSGTLLTVDFALEQGRDVFVVPGNINSKNSVGTNKLIQQGAKIVLSWQDILKYT